jgi:hypothetical protein
VRPYLLLLATFVLSVLVGGTVVSSTTGSFRGADPSTGPSTGPSAGTPPAPPRAAPVQPAAPRPHQSRLDLSAPVPVPIDGFLTWAALDRTTGEIASAGDQTNTTESMIKVWVVADFLRRQAEAGQEPAPSDLADASAAIRDSDNDATGRLYAAGGGDRVVERMIDHCGLVDTTVAPGWWSQTRISAIDAVRLGQCVADGTAAGPEWTDWVLAQMRHVRGTTADTDQRPEDGFEGGRWGIIDGLPEQVRRDGVAIKNGWTRIHATGNWHLNCLAVTDDWVLAVLMQFPADHHLDYGAERCAMVAGHLFGTPPPEQE